MNKDILEGKWKEMRVRSKRGGASSPTTTWTGRAAKPTNALLFWVIIRVVRIAANRPSARTVTRPTREQMPGGGEQRTTHTTTRR